jgi:hypothetical protein
VAQALPINFSYYDKNSQVFVADISDLRGVTLGGTVRLQSPKSKQWAEFYMDCQHVDGEGDITHWTYLPTALALRRFPALAGTRFEIFND